MKTVHYTTPEEATEYLRNALVIVDALDTPADLREACFVQAATMLSAKQVFVEQSDLGPVALATMAMPQDKRH